MIVAASQRPVSQPAGQKSESLEFCLQPLLCPAKQDDFRWQADNQVARQPGRHDRSPVCTLDARHACIFMRFVLSLNHADCAR